MKATDLKRLLKAKYGVTCRVSTGTGKGGWITAWVPSDASNNGFDPLTYSSPPFPLDFRQKCLRAVYGQDCNFAENGNAGNIRPYSIAMVRREWEQVLAA